MIDPASIAVGLTVGTGLGAIGGALFAFTRHRAEFAMSQRRIMTLYETNKELIKHGRKLEIENDLLLTEKQRRDAPLKAANAARHAKAETARRERMEIAQERLTAKGAV